MLGRFENACDVSVGAEGSVYPFGGDERVVLRFDTGELDRWSREESEA